MVYQFQPTNPLGAFAQSYQLSRGIQDDMAARRQAEMDAQAQQARQRDLQAAVMELRRNPSPEALAEFGLQFPEMKEEMTGYFSTLEAGKKATLTGAARDVLIAQRAGGNVQQVFERYASAAENSNDAATAKIFRDAAEVAKTDPEAASETARVLLGFADPDAYKLMYDTDVKLDTPIIKNLIAEGMQPGTPQFQAALREERTKVSFFHPDYGYVSGSPEFVQQVFGGQPPANTERLPTITTQEGYDALAPGQKYLGPDGTPYTKKGGGSSNATGGFRGP